MGFVAKFNHAATFYVDQMIMQPLFRGLVPSATIAKVAALQYPFFLKQPHCSIDRGERDVAIQRNGSPVHLFDIGMIRGMGEHKRDDPTLPRHA